MNSKTHITNIPLETTLTELHSFSFNPLALSKYLNEIFFDLQRRSSSTKDQTITRLTFIESLSFPLIINQRLFYSFTNSKSAYSITRTQYVQGFLKLYTGNIESKLSLIARMFDFNLNGLINVNDINLLFKQLYIRSTSLYETNEITFKEISSIIYERLTPKRIITVSSFKDIIRYSNSDILYLFCFYLNMFCPFTEEQVNYFHIVTPTSIKNYNSNSNSKYDLGKQLQDNGDNSGYVLTHVKSECDIKPSESLLRFLKENYGIIVTSTPSYEQFNNNNNIINTQNKLDEGDLNELDIFEKDISSTIASINVCNDIYNYEDDINKDIDALFQQQRSLSTFHNYRSKSNQNINNIRTNINSSNINNINNGNSNRNSSNNNNSSSSSQFDFTLLKSNTKNFQMFSKIKTHITTYKHNSSTSNTNSNTQLPAYKAYTSLSNFYETNVNYYTRSGSVREAKLLLIGDCLYVHIFNGLLYKFLKLINLKFTYVDEIESCETLSKQTLLRVKLSSLLNKHYTDIIFSSQEHLEMKSLISKLYQVTKRKTIEDNYIIIKDIYHGTMSHIFYGRNKETNTEVAIKQISLTASDTLSSYETILWERDIMEFLIHNSHPNITKVYDVYRTQEYMYFISEYMPSGNLRKFLFEYRNALDVDVVMNIMNQISFAVEFMHLNGIVHRDLKLENVLVKCQSGGVEVKVIDFGFGVVLGKGDVVNDAYGTLSYASPERLRKVPYNFKTDIWSLGVIFYIMLYKKFPFDGDGKDNKKIYDGILKGEVVFPEIQGEKNGEVSKLKELISSCLNKKQKLRPNILEIRRFFNN